MNSFPGAPPKSVAETLRFDPPAVVPRMPAEPARPVDGQTGLPVPPEPSTGSWVLAGLPTSAAMRTRWLQARKAREGSAANGHGDAQGLRRHDVDDSLYFDGAGRVSSRRQSSGNDASRDTHRGSGDMSAANILQSKVEVSRRPASHMAGHALALPALCQARAASHGMWSMPGFLRETMQSLVIDFTQDLADKIEHRFWKGEGIGGDDAIQPVREACEEFLRLMRPLYQRYVPTLHLYDEACEVLCGAQPLLQKLLRERAGDDEFSRIMTETICPLLPVIVMSCKPRDGHGSVAEWAAA